jgi:GNAT superfamily N-acetyltransferase
MNPVQAARAFNRDYFAAVAFWVVGRTTRLQVHHVLSIPLEPRATPVPPPPAMRFLAVRNGAELRELRELNRTIENQLNEESGPSCQSIIDKGGAVYAVIEAERVACQLNIRHGAIAVDSPTALTFSFAAARAFLDFLHTRDEYRGRGLARALIQYACDDAARLGMRRCFAHVRATNHSSLRAFRRGGWQRSALILSTRSGRFLGAPGCRRAGMDVSLIPA